MVGLVYWGPDGSARAGEGLVNLKVMSWVPGVRYSSVAAADPAGNAPGDRLTVDVSRQIPRRPASLRLRRGVVYGAGLRLDLLTPAGAARHPLVVYLPGGGFVFAPRAMARRERGFIAAAGYAVASVEYRTTRQHATYGDALTDISSAIGHLTGHADEYGINPGRVAV
jgi:acetyl esterase/lipase